MTNAKRRETTLDIAKAEITIDRTMFSLRGLDPEIVTGLALDGLRLKLLTSRKAPMETYRLLQRGQLKLRAPTPTPELDPWKRAMAFAIVEAAKKSSRIMPVEQAEAAVRTFDRAALMKAKQDPLVIKHYRRLTGEGSSVLDLLPPEPADPTPAEEDIQATAEAEDNAAGEFGWDEPVEVEGDHAA